MKKKLIILIISVLFVLFITSFVYAQWTVEETKIDRSIAVLEEMAAREDQAGAFSQLLSKAEGIVIQ